MAEEIDDDRRERHLAFINENLDDILSRSATAYKEFGRGIWVFSDNEDQSTEEGSTGVYLNELSGLPQDGFAERVQGMVAKYDPATQAVVALRESDGSDHVYTVGTRTSLTLRRAGRGKSHER
jgi:hypothetical protein